MNKARNEIIYYLNQNKQIDLIICDEFHRFPDSANTINDMFFNIPVLYLSATPYNWYTRQLTLDEDGKEQEGDNEDNKLKSFGHVLKLLGGDTLLDNYQKLINNMNNTDKLNELLKKYIWRNERIYGLKNKRLCLPTAKQVCSDTDYTESAKSMLTPRLPAPQAANNSKQSSDSVLLKLFPGIYSFACKGSTKLNDNFYQCLNSKSDKYIGNNPPSDFLFKKDNTLDTDRLKESFKLTCIKKIQVDPIWQMLWITPVHTRFEPGAPFVKNASKLLVFSGYIMVPREISTIFSSYVRQKCDATDVEKNAVIGALDNLSNYDNNHGETLYENLPDEGFWDKVANIPCGLSMKDYLNELENLVTEYQLPQDCDHSPTFISRYITGSPYIILRRMGADPGQAMNGAEAFYQYLKKNDTRAVLSYYLREHSCDEKIISLLNYFCAGCLEDMLREYYFVSGAKSIVKFVDKLKEVCGFEEMKITVLNKNTYQTWFNPNNTGNQPNPPIDPIPCHYAVRFTPAKDDTDVSLTSKVGFNFQANIQNAFNSPFWPMILSTTSSGQEGIDLDAYCRRIMHYTVPKSPMAFEQRDGRIDRRQSLATREKINILWGRYLQEYKNTCEFWKKIFLFGCDKSGLSPQWSLREEVSEIGLERIVPFLPGTAEFNAYTTLVDIKHVYRSAFGMPDEDSMRYNMKGLSLNNMPNPEK